MQNKATKWCKESDVLYRIDAPMLWIACGYEYGSFYQNVFQVSSRQTKVVDQLKLSWAIEVQEKLEKYFRNSWEMHLTCYAI